MSSAPQRTREAKDKPIGIDKSHLAVLHRFTREREPMHRHARMTMKLPSLAALSMLSLALTVEAPSAFAIDCERWSADVVDQTSVRHDLHPDLIQSKDIEMRPVPKSGLEGNAFPCVDIPSGKTVTNLYCGSSNEGQFLTPCISGYCNVIGWMKVFQANPIPGKVCMGFGQLSDRKWRHIGIVIRVK